MFASSSRAPDVIVAGGGVIGLSSAFELSAAGLRVRLLDARAVGSGATGAALGALMPHTPLKQSALTDIQIASLAALPGFVARVEALSGIPCHYRRCGRLEILPSAKAARNAQERIDTAETRWADLGKIPLTWVDQDAARAEMPWIAASEHGYLRDDVTAQIDPPSLAASLAAACRAQGVEIVEGQTVMRIDDDGEGVTVTTERDTHSAARAVVSSGIAIMQCLGHLATPIPMSAVKGEAMHLPHLGTTETRPIVYGHGGFALSRSDGIHLGSTSEKNAPLETTVTPEGLRQLQHRCTQLLNLDPATQSPRLWSGFRPVTPDRQPVVGPHPDAPRIVVAGGHFKIGLGLAPATAQAVTQLAQDATPDPAWQELAPARFAADTAYNT